MTEAGSAVCESRSGLSALHQAPQLASRPADSGTAQPKFEVLFAKIGIGRQHLLLSALVAFSWGVMTNLGAFSGPSILDIVLGTVLAGLALAAPRDAPGPTTLAWFAAVAIIAAGGIRYVVLLPPLISTALALAIIGAVITVVTPRQAWVRVCAALLGSAALVALTLLGWDWGRATIDVFQTLQTSTAALLHGQDPYSPTTHVLVQVAPGLFDYQRMPFNYFPGAVLLAAPARALGDVRVTSVIAFVALFAFSIRLALQRSRDQRRVWQTTALCIASPLTIAMIQFAWLDVYSMAGFAGWLALRGSHRALGILGLVIALCVKPTLLIALVPLWLWSHRARVDVAMALLGTAAVILPFVIMAGPVSLYHDVVGVYGKIGFRYDGLTLSAWWYTVSRGVIPLAISVGAGALLGVFTLRRRPVSLSDALIAGAFLSAAGFLLAKQAFLNYYFIPIWLLILALAARGLPLDDVTELPVPSRLLAITTNAIRRVGRRRGTAGALGSPSNGG